MAMGCVCGGEWIWERLPPQFFTPQTLLDFQGVVNQAHCSSSKVGNVV